MLKYLAFWIDLARVVPGAAVPKDDAAGLAWKALPGAIYLTILLALSYTARQKMPVPLTLIGILVLGCAFTGAVSLGLSRAGAVNLALKPVSAVQSGPGLILSRAENVMVLLKESNDVRSPRLVSLPGQPLIYQELPLGPNNTVLNLPALAFGTPPPWFIQSLDIDLSLSAGELKSRLGNGYVSFAAYAFSLILLLGSLRFLLELSQWPLANLFLGALVFRLVLALETFLNAREINALIGSFLTGRVPAMLITPLVFCALAVLVIFYTLLSRIAKTLGSPDTGPGRDEDD
ncbi:MAG: hypothetical protein FWC45_03250 [Treponema sp.]|nr:hypothetical protein [Treponema sp.]